MQIKNLETKMELLHDEINSRESVKGSILIGENGLHVSSKLPNAMHETRVLSAHLARVFRYFNQISELSDFSFKIGDTHFHMKHIPSKKLLLTTLSESANPPQLQELMNWYSRVFQNIL